MEGSPPTPAADRGRQARSPREIPRPGWRDVALRVKSEASDDNVGLVAAGVAFYGLLALAPALAALVTLYGLVSNPAAIEREVSQLGVLPGDARDILMEQLGRIAASSDTALGAGLAGSLLLALWSASKGAKALVTAMNIAYDERETRGFLHLNALAVAFTAASLVAGALGLLAIGGVPALLGTLGLGPLGRVLVAVLPWIVLLLGVHGLVALLYRYGPCREEARWKWITPGSVLATVLWAGASLAFSVYVSQFASYNETYGTLGAVVVLLMWLWISGLLVLMGAELNAEMEHQTSRDTTEGPERPMGRRGAHVADTLGPVP